MVKRSLPPSHYYQLLLLLTTLTCSCYPATVPDDTKPYALERNLQRLIRSTWHQSQAWSTYASLVPPTTHAIIAMENEKTLAMLEIKYELPEGQWRLIDCVLFDTVKHHDDAIKYRTIMSNFTHTEYRYSRVDYETMLDANEVCRFFARHQRPQDKAAEKSNFNENQFDTFLTRLDNVKSWIAPDTLWCGAGDIAEKYWDLGPESDVDMCCREHDHCPVRLAPNEQLYGATNHGRVTVSLCECDRKFKQCLHETNSDYGRKISWIYFGLLDVKCLSRSSNQCSETERHSRAAGHRRRQPCPMHFVIRDFTDDQQ